jgi:subtilisin family serine protease
MVSSLPAYSSPFARDSLQHLAENKYLDGITPEWAWGGSTGKGVRVAVIDSGIDADHPMLKSRVAGYVAISEQGDQLDFNTEPHTDVYGHGTACAGIIGELAPDCELYSVRVLGQRLSGRGTVFAAGLKWAIENKMNVCNLSLGTTRKEYYGLLHELVDQAYFQNLILVTAANNMPVPSFPSLYASVISVASHEGKDPYCFYYNPQPPVEFGAPGIDLPVAWLGGTTLTATGNSFAAPHITGLVARILGKYPGLTLFQVKSILRALAANVKKEEDHGAA